MYWPKTRGRIASEGDTGFGFWFRFGFFGDSVRFRPRSFGIGFGIGRNLKSGFGRTLNQIKVVSQPNGGERNRNEKK